MISLEETIRQNDIKIEGFLNSKLKNSLVITCRPFTWKENYYENKEENVYAIPYTTNQHLIPLEECINLNNKYRKVFYYSLPQQHTYKGSNKYLINVLIVDKESENELVITFIDAYTRYQIMHHCVLKDGIYTVDEYENINTAFTKTFIENSIGFSTKNITLHDCGENHDIFTFMQRISPIVLMKNFSEIKASNMKLDLEYI